MRQRRRVLALVLRVRPWYALRVVTWLVQRLSVKPDSRLVILFLWDDLHLVVW